MDDLIQGFIIGKSVRLTIANDGHAVLLGLANRAETIDVALSVDQSRRLRRLLSAAEKRAK